jgi:hypothetical protein
VEFFLKNNDKNKIKEMKDHKNKIKEMEKYTFCKDHKIPDNGAFIIKNKPTIQVAIFKKVTHK